MRTGRYQLAKKFRKQPCPECGKRRFRPYVDTETGDMLPPHVGICDRENACQYRFTALDWIASGGGNPKPEHKAFKMPTAPRSDFRVPEAKYRKTLDHTGNVFVEWLRSVIAPRVIDHYLEEYRVGTFPRGVKGYESLAGGTVFWQHDKDGGIRNGKVMCFDADGHRTKTVNPTWISRIMTGKPSDEIGAVQCVFGEHLLSKYPDAIVCLVESEKTALIARCFYRDKLWMAVGGADGLSITKMLALAGRHVVLFPDIGMYEKWSMKAAELQPLFSSVRVNDILECMAHPEDVGADLADFLLPNLIAASGIDLFPNPQVTESKVQEAHIPEAAEVLVADAAPTLHPAISKLISINPAIAHLIDVLELDITNITISHVSQPS